MSITIEKKMIDGKIFEVHVDSREEQVISRYVASEKAMARIGIRLDSYSASTIKGRKSIMGGAMQARLCKGGMSSNQRRQRKIEREQAFLNRTANA
jgi:hypothetical protein